MKVLLLRRYTPLDDPMLSFYLGIVILFVLYWIVYFFAKHWRGIVATLFLVLLIVIGFFYLIQIRNPEKEYHINRATNYGSISNPYSDGNLEAKRKHQVVFTTDSTEVRFDKDTSLSMGWNQCSQFFIFEKDTVRILLRGNDYKPEICAIINFSISADSSYYSMLLKSNVTEHILHTRIYPDGSRFIDLHTGSLEEYLRFHVEKVEEIGGDGCLSDSIVWSDLIDFKRINKLQREKPMSKKAIDSLSKEALRIMQEPRDENQ